MAHVPQGMPQGLSKADLRARASPASAPARQPPWTTREATANISSAIARYVCGGCFNGRASFSRPAQGRPEAALRPASRPKPPPRLPSARPPPRAPAVGTRHRAPPTVLHFLFMGGKVQGRGNVHSGKSIHWRSSVQGRGVEVHSMFGIDAKPTAPSL